jgi:glycosyltransferase involved in cell wall biosynthesis
LAYLRAPEGLPKEWVADHEATVPISCRRAHQIIAVSEFSKTDIVNAFDIDPDRIQVVYHGISEGLHPPTDPEADRAHLAKRYGIDREFILYLGTLQPNKNIEGLCEAFQIMRGRGYSGQLVLAGAKGWIFDEMWARIVARGHDQDVLLTGFVDTEDIPLLYGNCSAFALVSFLEGFGIPVIEAMACGAPVVAANACSLIEVAGPAGLLVDPHDGESIAAGLERTTQPGPERGELIRAGLEWAATFTWEKTAAQHVRAYRLALESTAS